MAFVYRSETNTTVTRQATSQQIGPGTYVSQHDYNLQQKNNAPFNSKEQRESILKKEKFILPGPGAYTIETIPEKASAAPPSSSDLNAKGAAELPKSQANFKSQSKRFASLTKTKEWPGPGEYETSDLFQEVTDKTKPSGSVKKANIIERLMKMNHYQSTPSIPSKMHLYGYTETPNHEFTLNRIPGKLHEGTIKDSVGPGEYEMQDCFDDANIKGTSWHKYKEKRITGATHQVATPALVGPGSYERHNSANIPLYKTKQSMGFASHTMRSMDNRQGHISTLFTKQRITQRNQSAQGTYDEDSDDDEDYIEDAVPGPGHYNPQIESKKKKQRLQGNFGSQQMRFQNVECPTNAIGPGDYNPIVTGIIGKNSHEVRVRNPPFLSSDTRFSVKKNQDLQPGPGAYEQHQNLEEKLIQKVQKGYRGNFGTTQRRFKDPSALDDLPGPGTYIENLRPVNEEGEVISETVAFKSVSKRALYKNSKDQKPPIGTYQLNYFDIERRVKNQQEQDDPEMKVKVPNLGFNTSQARFRFFNNKRSELEEDDDELHVIKERRNEEKKFKKENKLLSKAERFNYDSKKINGPAPGYYYDPNLNTWIKRTYNINFADF